MATTKRHIARAVIRVRPVTLPDDFPTSAGMTTDYRTMCDQQVNARHIGISDAEPNCQDCIRLARRSGTQCEG